MNDDDHRLTFLVEGSAACFRRPEFVDDFVSYDTLTPLAAKRMLKSAYSVGDGIEIHRIQVLRPINHRWSILDHHRLIALRNVAYLILAHIGSGDEAAGVAESGVPEIDFEPHETFLGLRSLPGTIRQLRTDEDPMESELTGQDPVDLGWMLFDVIGRGRARARYFRPTMVDGVIDVRAYAREMLVG